MYVVKAWPLVLVVLLAIVFIRLGRNPKPHGDNPPDSGSTGLD
ncbi:hypothetical protein COL8621_01305 [Actibacterium lipolyticum]|uniref:Uncharacterized protein n=2 Tax=Actibacterium lipolyticum TaxID=1524263 RepID=A0A238JUT8_9RHOB|nr:hypothetical protein COL8621_01305 [Actibacterium lipolyticum]